MLAKVFALWIVVLVVTPFTEPFSTFKVGELRGVVTRRSPSEFVLSLALDDVAAPNLPCTTPVEVRPIAGVDVGVRSMLVARDAESPFTENTSRPPWFDRGPHQRPQEPLTRTSSVLRL